MRVIQERNGTNNTPTVSYTRGNDLSGSLEGAGGIGGLLARSHGYSSGAWSTHNFYQADGNGNITYMVNSSQSSVAAYKYDPFGNLLSSSGSLAAANVYRFSSKEIHINSGMYYYGYRFYDPNLQRWINRDPLGDIGSLPIMTAGITPIGLDDNGGTSEEEFLAGWTDVNRNLFGAIGNSPLNLFDPFGLSQCHIWDIHDKKNPDPIIAD